MPSLTDEQIVRRIAKFMGWSHVNNSYAEATTSYPCRWHGTLDEVTSQWLPDWLASYDAIAEVWRKTDMAQRIIACETKDIENWWDATPREHAEAIAVALGGES